MRVVYADTVFVMNFCFDWLLLFLTCRFIRKRVKHLRLIIASAFGAAFGLVCCVLISERLISVILAVLFLPVLCICAFGRDTITRMIRICLIMLGFSFILCGTSTVIMMIVGKDTDVLYLIFACSLMFVFCFTVMDIFHKGTVLKDVNVTIENKGRTCHYILLCDSGNQLVDPISGFPMIMLGKSKKNELLEENDKTRTVVYKTASGVGFTEAFTPECVYVKNEKKDASVCFVDDDNLSDACADGIIPTYLL